MYVMKPYFLRPQIPRILEVSDPVIPPEEWRHVLRSLLREATYLPDPIARSAVHDQIMSRFQRYNNDRRMWVELDAKRQIKRHKAARQTVSLLRRANDGYSRPLEKVLRFAYGRNGKRRREMLAALLAVDIPTDSSEVQSLIGKSYYGDDWKPPSIAIDLLKSQNNNPLVTQLSNRPPVRDLEPKIPRSATLSGPLCARRRKNIRKEWYNNVLGVLLPPLPESELDALTGLIDGRIPWKHTERRTSLMFKQRRFDTPAVIDEGRLIRKVLTVGPAKGETFAEYTSGRSHTIDRRFMTRMWKRISCMVPRSKWDQIAGKFRFHWDTPKSVAELSIPTNPVRTTEVMRVRDSKGKRTKRILKRPQLHVRELKEIHHE